MSNSDCRNDKSSNISIDMIDDNPFHLKGTFFGPEETPYEGGKFDVVSLIETIPCHLNDDLSTYAHTQLHQKDIVVPESYPFQPVKMKFITKVYHPNISSASGAICLDILKDAWSPVLTLKSTLISLQSLLCSPEPNDPQDAEVAKHYMTSRESFNETAKYWSQIYAGAPGGKGAGDIKDAAGKEKEAAGLSDSSRAIALAGLSEEHVTKFVDMGFGFSKVVRQIVRLIFERD